MSHKPYEQNISNTSNMSHSVTKFYEFSNQHTFVIYIIK